MACAAMRLPLDEAIPLAERAVAKDASLTWTYYFIRDRNFQDRVKNRDRRMELLAGLSTWDPENAAPYLAIAENVEGFPRSSETRQLNPQWLEAMDRALSAKTYDSYIARRLQLDRRVIPMHSIHELFDIFRDYGTVPIPWITSTSAYAAFLERRAEKAGNRDADEGAANQLWSLANLGSLLRLNAVNDMERFNGSEMREIGFAHLQPILIRLGKGKEAYAIAYAARLEAADRAKLTAHASSPIALSMCGTAAAAHLFVILMTVSFLLIATAASLFAVRRTKSQFVLSVVAYASPSLVLSSLGFLGVSYPYAQASKSYLTGTVFDQNATMRLLSLGEIPALSCYGWYFLPWGLWFWSSVIVVGIVICIWIGFRAVSHQVL